MEMILRIFMCLVFILGVCGAGNTATSITINTVTPVRTITLPFWGVNFVAYWDTNAGSQGSMYALKNAGIQILRFPGGVPALYYDWAKPLQSGYTTITTDILWQYALGVGAKLMLQTNPAAFNSNNYTGAHAADWVRYCKAHGIQAPFWEVGNENDNPGESGDPTYGYGVFTQTYLDRFVEHYRAMKAADPSIMVVGPASTNWGIWWNWNHDLTQFMQAVGDKQGSNTIDGVSLHWYPGPSGCPGVNMDIAEGWYDAANFITQTIKQYHSKSLPVLISECNALANQNCDGGQTISSAIQNADMFGVFRATNVDAVQFFGSIHGDPGWGLSRDNDTPLVPYYILPLWTKAGNIILNVTGVTDQKTTLAVYPSKRANGDVTVVVINKQPYNNTVTFNFQGTNFIGKQVQIYEVRPTSISNPNWWDKSCYYNGVLNPVSNTATPLPGPKTETMTSTTYTSVVYGLSVRLYVFQSGVATANPTVKATTKPSS